MPLIFPTSVVSFSSEDINHPVSNLLNRDTFRKWKCKEQGEREAFVILKFENAVRFTAIDVGNESSAMIEIFVGRSGGDTDVKYEVLLSSSVLMSPSDSRTLNNPCGVRSYSASLFDRETAAQKWDLVKICVSQIFNKHTQFGLTFVKFTAASDTNTPAKIGIFSMRKPLGLLDDEEDEDDTSPQRIGAMFAKRLSDKNKLGINDQNSTNAAIREASLKITTASQLSNEEKVKEALSVPKLVTHSVSREKERSVGNGSTQSTSGSRFNDSDKLPSRKTLPDIIPFNKERKYQNPSNSGSSQQSPKSTSSNNVESSGRGRALSEKTKGSNQKDKIVQLSSLDANKTDKSRNGIAGNSIGMRQTDGNNSDLLRSIGSTSNSNSQLQEHDKPRKPFDKLLEGVVFVMSGFENPYRRNLRDRAIEMGAKCKSDWDSSCTHLICAFVNTPKFREVRQAGNGKIVKKEWIERSYGARCRFPWRRFCLDRNDKGTESEEEIHELEETSSEGESGREEILEDRPSSSYSQSSPKPFPSSNESDGNRGNPSENIEQGSNSDRISPMEVVEVELRDGVNEVSSSPLRPNKRKRTTQIESTDEKNEEQSTSLDKKTLFDADTDIDDGEEEESMKSPANNDKATTNADADSDTDFDEDEEPEPTSKPKHNNNDKLDDDGFFRNSVFFISLSSESKDIKRIILKQNGDIREDLTDDVEYWITDAKEWSEEFSDALSDNPNLCFVNMYWILECKKAAKKISCGNFMLTPC